MNTYTVSILANGRPYEYTVEHDDIQGALELVIRAHSMLIRGDSEVVSVAKVDGAKPASPVVEIDEYEIKSEWNNLGERLNTSYSQDAVDLVRWALARYGEA